MLIRVETENGNNFGRRSVSKIELSGNIAGGFTSCYWRGHKILLKIYLTVIVTVTYIDRKGEFRIINKNLKILSSNFHK